MVAVPSRSTSGLLGTFSPSTVGITACVVVADGGLVATVVLVASGVGGAVGSGATTVSGSEPHAIRTSANNPSSNRVAKRSIDGINRLS